MTYRYTGFFAKQEVLAALTLSILLAACGGGGGGSTSSDGGVSPPVTPPVTPPPASTLSLFAGDIGVTGSVNGQGIFASFNQPSAVAADSAGNIYVADSGNNLIRKITPDGAVTSFAGSGTATDTDGVGTAASINNPLALTFDKNGNLYVTEGNGISVRKITPDGTVSTIANQSTLSYATNARLPPRLSGIAVDASGNLYVTDSSTSIIVKIPVGGSPSLFAGGLYQSFYNDGNTIASARFTAPTGIAIDASGNIFVSDAMDFTIREIYKSGFVTTVAGKGNWQGNVNSVGTSAEFGVLGGLAIDSNGFLYVADSGNATIRRIILPGVVFTQAGTSGYGGVDGTASTATFSSPKSVAFDGNGNLYVADTGDNVIRKITPSGIVSTIAGQTPQIEKEANYASNLYAPGALAVDANGNVIVFDQTRAVLYRVTPTGNISALAGSNGYYGNENGVGSAAAFTGGFPESQSNGVAIDSKGNIYVADAGNNQIRMVTPAGTVTNFAGSGVASYQDGTASKALFHGPYGIAVDARDNVYVADTGNNNIRKITQTGTVTTLAGSGAQTDVDGTGAAASFQFPNAMAIDKTGNLYVTELNGSVRKITQAGVVTTLPAIPLSVDVIGLTTVSLKSIAVDDANNVYVTNSDGTICEISATGAVSRLAGVSNDFDIPPFIPGALPGSISRPIGLAYRNGMLYFSTLQAIATINNLP